MKAFMVKKMDHLSQSDMAYIFGNILQFTGSIKKQRLTDGFMGLNIVLSNLFLKGESKSEILKPGSAFIAQHKMDEQGVDLLEEYRSQVELTQRKKAK